MLPVLARSYWKPAVVALVVIVVIIWLIVRFKEVKSRLPNGDIRYTRRT